MGRNYLNGSSPGQGTRATRCTITLPPKTVTFLKRLGGGNLSRGVRIAAKCVEAEHQNEQSKREIE